MPKITLDQFIKQWDSKIPVANRVDFNITEFATKAGEYSKRFFRMSFASGGFYATGNKWEPRESRWGKKYTHKVLDDTGILKGAISGKSENTSRQSGKKVELLLLKWELFIIFIQKKYLNPEVAKEDRTHMGKDMQQFITPIQKFPHLQLISGLKRNLHKDNLLASMTDLIIILIPTMFLLYLKDFHYDKRKAKHKKRR